MSKLSINQLAEYAVDQLEAGVDSTLLSRKLAAFLLDTRQTREAGKLSRAIEAELNKRGQNQVTITSAHKVSEETKKQLATLLGAKNPVFSEEIDPQVIGGVKAKTGETQVDLTVRGRLQRFQAKIVGVK